MHQIHRAARSETRSASLVAGAEEEGSGSKTTPTAHTASFELLRTPPSEFRLTFRSGSHSAVERPPLPLEPPPNGAQPSSRGCREASSTTTDERAQQGRRQQRQQNGGSRRSVLIPIAWVPARSTQGLGFTSSARHQQRFVPGGRCPSPTSLVERPSPPRAPDPGPPSAAWEASSALSSIAPLAGGVASPPSDPAALCVVSFFSWRVRFLSRLLYPDPGTSAYLCIMTPTGHLASSISRDPLLKKLVRLAVPGEIVLGAESRLASIAPGSGHIRPQKARKAIDSLFAAGLSRRDSDALTSRASPTACRRPRPRPRAPST